MERSHRSDGDWITHPFTVPGDGVKMAPEVELSVAKLIVVA